MRSHDGAFVNSSNTSSPRPPSVLGRRPPPPPTPKTPRAPSVASNGSTKRSSTTSTVARNSSPATPARAPTPRITATATPTTTRLQRPTLSSSLRTPLRQRDHNVPGPVNTSRPAPRPSSTTMPYEKGSGTATRQPAMPSLSATAAKAMNRTPLTPKIATKTQPAVTPLGRRRNDNPSNYSGANGGKDDFASPVSNFLGHNITPRSGSRQIRVDSANTTPNGTPNPDRNGDWDSRSGLGISGSMFDGESTRKQIVTFSPTSDATSRQDTPDTKFFYASDAKSVPPAPQPRPLSTQQRPSTFVYANGSTIERNRPMSPSVVALSPILAPPPDNQSSKFFYANGTPNLQPAFKPSFTPSGPGSTVSTTSKLATGRSGATTPGGGYAMAPRPASPSKQPSIQSLKGGVPPPSRSQISSAPPLGTTTTGKRRISIDTSSQFASHSRADSITSADALIMSKFMASQTSSEVSSSPPAAPNPAMTMASIIQAADDFAESEESRADTTQSEIQSPTKSTNSSDPLNDLVANARRERKVQDLEITNASLEAINRSLERQLRKQTAELRRYRRLSRSGRFSIASVASSLAPSELIAGASGIDGLDLSDLSEEDELPEEDDSDSGSSDYDSSSASPSSKSPSTRGDRDARRRKKDEQRLQLDLSQHRQLLVDSQKINQSIKRCLNWTEELIKEGKKALEYKVRVSDVELGGRVLAPPDEEDDHDHDHDHEGEATIRGFEAPLCLAAPWGKEPQDRDSGIEIAVDGG